MSVNGIDWSILAGKILDTCFMSQQELAEYCGVSQQSVSNWVNKIRRPGLLPGRRLLELAEKNDMDIKSCGMESVSRVLEHLARHDDKVLRRILVLYTEMQEEDKRKFLRYAVSIAGG